MIGRHEHKLYIPKPEKCVIVSYQIQDFVRNKDVLPLQNSLKNTFKNIEETLQVFV